MNNLIMSHFIKVFRFTSFGKETKNDHRKDNVSTSGDYRNITYSPLKDETADALK